ncbi:MAG: hypothetical protein V1909_02190 [Candidatus Micrarchaeota archaeon]
MDKTRKIKRWRPPPRIGTPDHLLARESVTSALPNFYSFELNKKDEKEKHVHKKKHHKRPPSASDVEMPWSRKRTQH